MYVVYTWKTKEYQTKEYGTRHKNTRQKKLQRKIVRQSFTKFAFLNSFGQNNTAPVTRIHAGPSDDLYDVRWNTPLSSRDDDQKNQLIKYFGL